MADSSTVMAQTVCQNEVTTSSSQNHQSVIDSIRNKPTYCLRHTAREVSLFCRTCDRLACASCIIDGNHSDHKFCEIDHVTKEKQVQLRNEVNNRGKEMCEQVQNSITHMEQEKESVTEKCTNLSENIAKQKVTLIEEIETWSQGLQTTVTDHKTVKVSCLNDRLVQSDMCLSLLKVFQQHPESVDTCDGTKSIQALEILDSITNPPKIWEETPLSFLPGSGFCEGNMQTLFGSLAGTTCETSVSVNTCSEDIPQGNSVVVDTDEAVDSDQDSTDEESSYEEVDSETMYKCTKSPIDRIAPVDVNSAFIVIKKKLYLVDFSKHKGYIENEEPLMTGVVHITPVTEKGIYVQQQGNRLLARVTTTGKVYRFIDCGDDTLRCVGLSHSGQVIMCAERYISEMEGNTSFIKIIRSFDEYNENGVNIRSLIEIKKKAHYLHFHPQDFHDIVMTNSALYILNSTLYIPDKPTTTGSVINVLKDITYKGAIGRDPASRFHPRGMCQDKDGCLVVTDYWNHALHLLTPEGKFSKFLMREEDGLMFPTAVAIDNYRHLWIGQRDGKVHIIKYIP
ncbi:uncharacterized protein LOC110465455 [Mizuhopecten yessoensis]|uniref:uncharacterized protein LOC110465455 n=1 Tax=Mizuhopecten yessoensis TaxID=6573 RepID=UPI000B45D47A|nr:uncharacterized protein LOC110465455 [Mizuhopecten yessoensis]